MGGSKNKDLGKKYVPLLRTLLTRLDAVYLAADETTRPKVDARRSIVRADLRDRAVGLTTRDEITPAIGFLYRYGLIAHAARQFEKKEAH